MKKRLALLFVAILATIGIATPAQASSTWHGCPVSTVCLYQAQNYLQERWQSSLTNVYNSSYGSTTQCLNLPPAQWSNGTPVYDNSGSMISNNDVVTSPWVNYNVYYFNWAGCNPGGGYGLFIGGTADGSSTLSGNYPYGAANPRYHTITSIGLIPKP